MNRSDFILAAAMLFLVAFTVLVVAPWIIGLAQGTGTESLASKPEPFPRYHVPMELLGGSPGGVIRMTVAIPCWDDRQKRYVERALPRIRSAVITELGADLAAMAAARDLASVKEAAAGVIDRQLPWEIDEVLLDGFIFM